MSAKPLIAVDLDEVLGCFVRALARWHNDTYGTTYTETDFHSYTFRDVWKCSEHVSSERVHRFLESRHFLDGIDVVPGAVNALRALHGRFRLAIVTSRQHYIEDATRAWLQQHFGGLFDEIDFGNHWGLHGEKKSKPDMCKAIGARVLIDDAVHYARQCAGVLDHVILFGDYAWNQAEELPEKVTRAKTWNDVLKIMDSLNLSSE